MKKEKKITIKDIALISGYSKTAVSFAFNSPEKIGKEACNKILEIAKKLNYIPNPLARNLSLGKHNTLGFLLPQNIEESLLNPYIVDVIRGLGKECQERGNTLTLIPPVDNSLVEAIKNCTVDGIATMGYIFEEGIEHILELRKLPIVMIDGYKVKKIPSININDTEAAFKQLDYVIKKGHKNISIISLPSPAFSSKGESLVERRKKGYEKALKNVDNSLIKNYTVNATRLDGNIIAHKILENKPYPTCIVSMSDIVAIGIIQELLKRGIKVPEEISVIGFDNIKEAEYIHTGLTSVNQPGFVKGIAAANYLFAILNNEKIDEHFIIPSSIIERGSFKEIINEY